MEVADILHMNRGDGELSYARNSLLQETVVRKALPILKHTIKGITDQDLFSGQCFKIADLGCSSSTNTLFVASNIMDIVIDVCKENNRKPPQFEVCLNDLFGNDFNTLFKLLPEFYAKRKEKGENFGSCFVSAIPGSFYNRLFSDRRLHFVHSSYSLLWLSKVPDGIESNTLNIYMAKTSPPNVLQAYGKQFKADFTKFLQLRSKEILCGGRMVLTLVGRSDANPTSDDGCCLWALLAQSLLDMVKEGLVRESDIKSFGVPIYYPCEDEVWNTIENEGSFSLESLSTFRVNWNPKEKDYKNLNDFDEVGQLFHEENTTKAVRAFTEPLLISHFGESIIDEIFKKYTRRVTEHLTNNKASFFSIAISLAKN
ncbi:S-adenosyl-L-methionine:benzoic acid/salicylic acid carboxyl methyltransferase 3-like [Bidens hawaiensis]|uniref:S-adenosyl-L-methionine:benzoic acid/salicylic acid carboxyl methyltransferase 3-like n=1 Tax=Bidens hawaiensis TaxID=980011 RepID=UPI00404B7760